MYEKDLILSVSLFSFIVTLVLASVILVLGIGEDYVNY
jgi:hypothetical protein